MGKRKFWNWVRDSDTGERTLVLNGTIAEESWFGDEVTPAIFRDELTKGEGDITVWINSLGGDVYAAAQIYNMLMDYKGKVTVRIDGIAALTALPHRRHPWLLWRENLWRCPPWGCS